MADSVSDSAGDPAERAAAFLGEAGGRVRAVASLTKLPAPDAELPKPVAHASCLEVRADLIPELKNGEGMSWLRERFDGALLFTLRSRAEGGRDDAAAADRAELLAAAAAAGYDYVDLEVERDVSEVTLSAVPAERRVLSWHGGPRDFQGMHRRFRRMHDVPAALYKLVPNAGQSGEEVAPLLFLRDLGRRDVIAFATGEIGSWARLLAPRFGAPIIFAAVGDELAAPGQIELERLVRDYGFPALRLRATLCGIVGKPVRHSLSPRLHNGAYRALGLPFLYVPFHVEQFGAFWLEVVESELFQAQGAPEAGLRGLSVTAPYKAAALAVAGASSPLAQRIESANTLIHTGAVWEAETTDPEGVVAPLRARGFDPDGRLAVVAGAGGAGAAAAAGLAVAGAKVVVANRSAPRGEQLAERLGVEFVPLAEIDPTRFDILVNATKLGSDEDDPSPFAKAPSSAAVVVEMVYASGSTRLERETEAAGGTVIGGREVLLAQALSQFRAMTGEELPEDLGREILGLSPADQEPA